MKSKRTKSWKPNKDIKAKVDTYLSENPRLQYCVQKAEEQEKAKAARTTYLSLSQQLFRSHKALPSQLMSLQEALYSILELPSTSVMTVRGFTI
jgi:hypothetical protein